jgi:uncharacterized protein (DUF1499 family)
MRRWGVRLIWFVVAIVLIFGILQLAGPERVWALFGPADLGPVNFEALQRRTTPNDALACPVNVCQAKADLVSPVFGVSAQDLRLAFARAIATEPRLFRVGGDDANLTERYVQRTRLMRFPDTIVVRFFDLPDHQSTIALYSRSQLGEGDMGVNLARVQRWLSALEQEVKPASMP